MKKENTRIKIMLAMAFVLPMLVSSCNDGPELPDTRSYNTPILFETENMTWLTEYDMVNNIYTTTITSGEINYAVKSGEDVPEGLIVTQVIKDQDGKTKYLDVDKIKELVESGNGFYEYEVELLKFVHAEKGKLNIFLEDSDDDEDYEYSHYYIVLESEDKKFGTQIKIDDRILLYTGISPLIIDLSGIKYPSKRHYDPSTGYYNGYEYSIWLPGDECELELPTAADCYIYTISLYGLLDSEEEILYQFKYNYDLPQTDESNQPLTEVLTEAGEFRFVKFDKDDFALKCKIFENQSGQERKISIRMQASYGTAVLNFIQAAK